MADESQIEGLLDQWEDLHTNGGNISFGAFVARHCPDATAEIVVALRKKIEAIESMNALLDQGHVQPSPASETKSSSPVQETHIPALQLTTGAEPVVGYKLVSRLGEGGFGEVWKAMGPGDVPVALKFLRLGRTATEVEMRALEITRHLRHPHILSTFGTWQKDGWLIIASELAGQSLYDRFRNLVEQGKAGIPKRELHSYMNDAAKAIDYLNKPQHSLGDGTRGSIQHRDIKPQNLLLSGGGVKVADFGIARFLESNATSHTGNMSVAYAAPEFFDGQTSDRSDQYSLAVAYCQLRSGRLPFEGTDIQIMRGHVEGEPDLSVLSENERPALLRALAKKPEDRWPSCRAFVRAIEKSSSTNRLSSRERTDSEDSTSIGWSGLVAGTGVLVLAVIVATWVGMRIEGGWNRTEPSSSTGLHGEIVAGNGDDRGATAGESNSARTAYSTSKDKTSQGYSGKDVEVNLTQTRTDSVVNSSSSISLTDVPVIAPIPGNAPHLPSAPAPKKQQDFVEIRKFVGHTGACVGILISPDGRHVLSYSNDLTIRLWDLSTGKELRQFSGHSGRGLLIARFTPDGRKVLVSPYGDRGVYVWETDSGRLLKHVLAQVNVRGMALSNDGKTLFTGSKKSIEAWNLPSNRRLASMPTREQVWSVQPLRDQPLLVAGYGDGSMKIWNWNSHRIVQVMPGHSGSVYRLTLAADGKSLLSASFDNTFQLWSLPSGESVWRFVGHSAPVTNTSFSPDGKYILSGSEDRTFRIWDATTKEEVARHTAKTHCTSRAVFSPDGQHVLSGGGAYLVGEEKKIDDTAIYLWKWNRSVTPDARAAPATPHLDQNLSTSPRPNGID